MAIELENRKKVLVISRHYLSHQQIKVIKKECGQDCLIIWDDSRFENADEIISRYERGKYDDIALVAPRDVLANLAANELRPIHLITIEVIEAERQPGDFKKGGTWIRAIAQRIKKVEVNITYY